MSWIIKRAQGPNTEKVICFLAGINEGYCVGGTRVAGQQGNPYRPEYWPIEWRKGDFELVEVMVSSKLADELEKMGTPEQTFSDGYEAWQDVLNEEPSGGTVVYTHEGEAEEEERGIWGG